MSGAGWNAEPAGWAAVAVLSVAVAVLGVRFANPEVAGFYHDDAIYALTGKAIAEEGSYRLINLPSTLPATKYPPLYPALLAAVWRISPEFPANLLALKAVNAVLLALLLPVVYAWSGRIEKLTVAERVLMCAVIGSSPGLFWFTDVLLSEPLFILLAAMLFLVVERGENWSAGRAVWASLLAGLCILTRMPGIALAVAAGVVVASRAGGRRLVPFLVVLIAVTLPWVIWRILVLEPVGLLESYYVRYEPSAWTRLLVDPEFVWRMASFNGLYFVRVAPLVFGLPHPVLLTGGLVLALVGAWSLRHRASALLALVWIGITTVVLLGHPYPMARYLTPLVFLMYVLMAVGAVTIGDRGARRLGFAGTPTLLLATGLLLVNVSWMRQHERVTKSSIHGDFGRPLIFPWAGFDKTVSWITANVPPGAVLASGHDTFYALATGHRAIRPWVHRAQGYIWSDADEREPDYRAVLEELDSLGVCYLVVDPLLYHGEGDWGRLTIRALLGHQHGGWNPVYETPDGLHQVWLRGNARCAREAPRATPDRSASRGEPAG